MRTHLFLAAIAAVMLVLSGCAQDINLNAPEVNTEEPEIETNSPTLEAATDLDLIDLPEPSDWNVGAAQVVYSDALLPPQGLFDWYAESGYYQGIDGQPSATLTADTLIWADQGTLTAEAVEWTLFVTQQGSPIQIDPSLVVDHCIVRQVFEGETLNDPWYAEFVSEIPVEGSTVRLERRPEMVEAHTQDLEFFTSMLSCTMRPNTTGETLLVSAVFSGVVNPTLLQTGQQIEVEMEEHESLVFYHLPSLNA